MEDAAIDSPITDAPPDAPKPPMMVRYTIDQPNQMRDTWLWSANPGVVYGGGTQGSVDAQDNESSLFWFNLGAIPANATVVTATFTIRTDDAVATAGGTVNAYAMVQSWVELEATYLVRANGLAWATVCAQPPSRATTVIGSFSPAVAQTNYAVTLAPSVVQQWVNDSALNYGFILVRGTSTQHLHFHMKESTSPPKLVVDVLVPVP
jgi:hypothetical protein